MRSSLGLVRRIALISPGSSRDSGRWSCAIYKHEPIRYLASRTLRQTRSAPKSYDRGPPSKEDTQTDFNALDILASTPVPSTAVNTCMHNGFALDNGIRVIEAGVLLVGGEAFAWRPWNIFHKPSVPASSKMCNIDITAMGVLDVLWPRPDLLIIGTGARILPISASTRALINEMGIRIEVQDTRNAAAQYNMLATERGIHQVAAALLPLG